MGCSAARQSSTGAIINGDGRGMTMRRIWLVALAGVLAAGCNNPAAQEMQKLQGEWIAVRMEEDGKTLSPDEVRMRDMKLRFEGTNATLLWAGRYNGTYWIDPTANPKMIDFSMPGLGKPGGYMP